MIKILPIIFILKKRSSKQCNVFYNNYDNKFFLFLSFKLNSIIELLAYPHFYGNFNFLKN